MLDRVCDELFAYVLDMIFFLLKQSWYVYLSESLLVSQCARVLGYDRKLCNKVEVHGLLTAV